MVGLVVIALVLGVLGGYWYSDLGRPELLIERESLAEDLEAAESTIAELNKSIVDAQLRESVASGALSSLQADLNSHRLQIAALREEVSHYRDLLAPNAATRGVGIQTLVIAQTTSVETFHFELRLGQDESVGRHTGGWVQIVVEADAKGRRIEIPLDRLEKRGEYPIKYRFRHFQQISGTMKFEAGIKPLRVVVTLRPEARDAKPVVRSFPWVVEAV